MAESRIGSTAARVKGVIDFIERGGDVIDAQRELTALKADVLALEQRTLAVTKENDELKQRNLTLEAFEVERRDYDNHRLPSGAWVVVPRRTGEQEFGEQGMYLCRRCFTQRKYEVLQPVNHGRALQCHECRSEIDAGQAPRGCVDINY